MLSIKEIHTIFTESRRNCVIFECLSSLFLEYKSVFVHETDNLIIGVVETFILIAQPNYIKNISYLMMWYYFHENSQILVSSGFVYERFQRKAHSRIHFYIFVLCLENHKSLVEGCSDSNMLKTKSVIDKCLCGYFVT